MPWITAETYNPDGNLIGTEDYWISEEDAHRHQLRDQLNAKHQAGLIALQNWDTLTLTQKDTVLKNLLWYALMREGYL